jgi:uncharacterized protein (TIGR03437 family)
MNTTTLWALAIAASLITTLSAAPAIGTNGVKNAASYANPAFPNGGIAQGSIFDVFGSGLGPAQIQYASSLPLPTTLSGTSVSVTVNGMTLPCPMVFTLAGQVAAILPSTTPVGTGTITVTYNTVASPTAPIKVVKNAVGLFTRNQQGSGPAVAQDVNNAYNSVLFAFHPNQTITLWGTGLGPINGSDADTPPTGSFPGVTASIGNQNAAVQYAGRSGYAGEDQINVTIPDGVSGCYVPVSVSVNGVTSNYSSISVAASGTVCSDPGFYSATDLQILANGGNLRTGSLALTQFGVSVAVPVLGNLTEDFESGSGAFQKWDANTFVNSTGGLSTYSVTSGSCTFYQVNGTTQYADPVQPAALDAGPVINVAGPSGSKQMTKNSTGSYSGVFSSGGIPIPGLPPSTPFLTPGNYTLDNGAGGTDIGAFKLTINVPGAIAWTEKAVTTNIDRTKSLPIHWTGGDPSGEVIVVGLSTFDTSSSGEFVCVGKNSDGGLTVPVSILSLMPPSMATSAGGGISLPGGEILVFTTNSARTNTPSGLDVLFAGTSSGDGKAVNFQ